MNEICLSFNPISFKIRTNELIFLVNGSGLLQEIDIAANSSVGGFQTCGISTAVRNRNRLIGSQLKHSSNGMPSFLTLIKV